MPYDNNGYYDPYSDAMYGGAPDECDIHWPKKPDECSCNKKEVVQQCSP